jgi:hypothetical protein
MSLLYFAPLLLLALPVSGQASRFKHSQRRDHEQQHDFRPWHFDEINLLLTEKARGEIT